MDPRLIRKVRRRDRVASRVITAGGLFVIVSVIGILVLIAQVALPLFFPPSFHRLAEHPPVTAPGNETVAAVGMDEYLETAYVLWSGGSLTFREARSGKFLDRVTLAAPGGGGARILRAATHGRLTHTLLWSDGSVSLVRVVFKPEFDEAGRRTIGHQVETLAERGPAPGAPGAPDAPATLVPIRAAARFDEETGATFALLLPGNRIALTRQAKGGGLLDDGEIQVSEAAIADPLPGAVTALLLDGTGKTLFAGTGNGHLLRWDVSDLEEVVLQDAVAAFDDGRAITVLGMLLGDFTLAVGDDRGGVSGWFPVQSEEGAPRRLMLIHRLKPHAAPVTAFLPSHKSKTMASISAKGEIHFDQFTTERHLGRIQGAGSPRLAGFSTRANGMVITGAGGGLTLWKVDIPHPEISWGGYFGPTWYESYSEPSFVWQSSAASDDFEPKLSIIPLVFGTLKGTFYGMVFAVPLGVLGALYTSSLMHPRLRSAIKPAFEIMGSVPTVVIGFLAALWLAPIVNASLTAFLLILGFLPVTVIAAMALLEAGKRWLPGSRTWRGYEFLLMVPAVVIGVWLAFEAGLAVDALVFTDGLAAWLFEGMGVRFDQRNSIVISMALGFAVLPTIFTLSDDALANVPRNLTAASLALGASRWQTVSRVVLPSASPGIFAALMVGLGRAVGETMIVLMATGNTPIMAWSPFNGMRTLAANIAVEIPEAPFGGTLYRTLFLSAVLLFLTTFVLNSAAEVVRQRLRKKFGQY